MVFRGHERTHSWERMGEQAGCEDLAGPGNTENSGDKALTSNSRLCQMFSDASIPAWLASPPSLLLGYSCRHLFLMAFLWSSPNLFGTTRKEASSPLEDMKQTHCKGSRAFRDWFPDPVASMATALLQAGWNLFPLLASGGTLFVDSHSCSLKGDRSCSLCSTSGSKRGPGWLSCDLLLT